MGGGKDRAKEFSNNSTPPEVLLWNRLKQDQIGFQFRRQDVFGRYILDFFCPGMKVNVEVDGKIHELKRHRDQERDSYLRSQGIIVIRFSAQSVLRDPDLVAFQLKCQLQRMMQKPDTSSDGEVGEERTG